MSIGDDIEYLQQCEQHGIAASAQLDKIEPFCDQANEELTRVINRLVMVRGQDASIPTLDQAIARTEGAMARINRISVEVREINEIVESITHMSNAYKAKLLS